MMKTVLVVLAALFILAVRLCYWAGAPLPAAEQARLASAAVQINAMIREVDPHAAVFEQCVVDENGVLIIGVTDGWFRVSPLDRQRAAESLSRSWHQIAHGFALVEFRDHWNRPCGSADNGEAHLPD